MLFFLIRGIKAGAVLVRVRLIEATLEVSHIPIQLFIHYCLLDEERCEVALLEA
jgi:hypothetical protein